MIKLSYPQQQIVAKLKAKEWRTAFQLRASMRSMEALERRGIVERRKRDGKFHWTQGDDTTYEWNLKPL